LTLHSHAPEGEGAPRIGPLATRRFPQFGILSEIAIQRLCIKRKQLLLL